MNEERAPVPEEPVETASAPVGEPSEEQETPKDPAIVDLVITFNQRTREVFINGPILDKFLCYGILEVARDAVQTFVDKKRAEAAASEIVPAFTIPQNLKRNGRG